MIQFVIKFIIIIFTSCYIIVVINVTFWRIALLPSVQSSSGFKGSLCLYFLYFLLCMYLNHLLLHLSLQFCLLSSLFFPVCLLCLIDVCNVRFGFLCWPSSQVLLVGTESSILYCIQHFSKVHLLLFICSRATSSFLELLSDICLMSLSTFMELYTLHDITDQNNAL